MHRTRTKAELACSDEKAGFARSYAVSKVPMSYCMTIPGIDDLR